MANIVEIWIAGGPNQHIPIAASGSAEVLSADVSALDWGASTIQVVVGGSGACKLTVYGSVDGVTLLHSFGDIVTGMDASPASTVLRLDDTDLAFFPILHFVFTETGGANAVEVRARIVGRLKE